MVTGPTGKKYIGQTQQALSERWRMHCKDAAKDSPYYLHRAIKKHGADHFQVEALIQVHTKEDLDFYESFAIDEFNTRDKNLGYNMAPGGRGGNKPECNTPEAVAKRVAKLKARTIEQHPCYRHDIKNETIKAFYLSGKTVKQISKELNISPAMAWRRTRAMGIIRPVAERNIQISKSMTAARKNNPGLWSALYKEENKPQVFTI